MTFNPYQTFPRFYQNKLIKHIMNKPKWTISDKNKRPISIADLQSTLLNGTNSSESIRGADQYESADTTTLPKLLNILPTASNHAYKFDAKKDGFVVLDIEKTCPDDLKAQFLQLPYLYGEYSLSGKGIHLICPIPSNWNEFPEFQDTTKVQEPNGAYEILLNHWVTFTRNTLPKAVSKGDGQHDLSSVFRYICKRISTTGSVKIKPSLDKPDIPGENRILLLLEDFEYNKKPTDFPMAGRPEGNLSNYEFGVTSSVTYQILRYVERDPTFAKYNYSTEQLAWIVFDKVTHYLPHREKHDTYRDGMPYLLYIALKAVTTIVSEQN